MYHPNSQVILNTQDIMNLRSWSLSEHVRQN
jgi:hypothetical protein